MGRDYNQRHTTSECRGESCGTRTAKNFSSELGESQKEETSPCRSITWMTNAGKRKETIDFERS